jgi:glycosyltransferase involved in cell wall biosynthesis
VRLLYVIDGLGTGGAERSLAEMLPGFRSAGLEVGVACFRRARWGVEAEILAAGHRVWFLESSGWAGRIARLSGLLDEFRPDLLHTTLFQSDLAGRIAALRTRPRVVSSLVNMPYEDERAGHDRGVTRAKLAAARWAERVTARSVHRFHAITHAVKDATVRRLRIPPDRIEVIHRGRDPSRLAPSSAAERSATRAFLGVGADHRLLVAVGREEYQKGHLHLIDAFARLATADPRLRLVMAGRPGNASAAMDEAVARSGVGDRIARLGHRDDVPRVIAAADLFVFPSLWEGLGGVLLEAMALGAPIIASDLPPVREILGPSSGAKTVPTADPVALAEAIGSLLARPADAAAMADRAQEAFHQEFTVAVSTERMLDLYRRVLAA